MVKWKDATEEKSPNPRKNRSIWENPNMRRLKCDDLMTSFHMTTDGQTPVQSDNKSFRERQVRARSARSNLLERYLARKGDRKNLVVSAAKEEKFLLTPSNRRC